MRPPLFSLLALGLSFAAALPAMAETPMSVEEFDAYVTGKTLTFSQFGQHYGTEEYLPDRKVGWRLADDAECMYGTYYQKAEYICFKYENDPREHCSTFWLEGDLMMSRFAETLPGGELSVSSETLPLNCGMPYMGV